MSNACFPSLELLSEAAGFHRLSQTSDGAFTIGDDGVKAIVTVGDRKVEFVELPQQTLAHVSSSSNSAGFPFHVYESYY